MESKNINDYTVFFGAKNAGNKFKVILSKLIKNKFAEPFDESSIKDVLDFSLKYYSKEFETICKNERSYEFYKLIFWLHEQSVELRRDEKITHRLNDIIGQDYFSIYIRVLKLILEEACLINIVTEELNPTFKERTEKVFDDLMYLGDEIFTLASLLAEQAMIGDVVAIEFTGGGIYKLKRKHFFDLAFEKIVNLDAYKPNSFVTDKNAEADFIKAVKESFDVNFHDVMGIIDGLFNHRKLKKWTALAIGTSEMKVAMKKFYSVPEESTESFLSGLYFSKDQKIPIKEVIRKPYQIDERCHLLISIHFEFR
ncbi:MAG: hypothetical protein ABJA71_16535 [Ginsengibacter sp.]